MRAIEFSYVVDINKKQYYQGYYTADNGDKRFQPDRQGSDYYDDVERPLQFLNRGNGLPGLGHEGVVAVIHQTLHLQIFGAGDTATVFLPDRLNNIGNEGVHLFRRSACEGGRIHLTVNINL